MAKFTDYTQKTKPADADLLLIHDNAGAANKKTPFSGVWSWILDKLASAVISQLKTTNKSIIPAINELNSKTKPLKNCTIRDFTVTDGKITMTISLEDLSRSTGLYILSLNASNKQIVSVVFNYVYTSTVIAKDNANLYDNFHVNIKNNENNTGIVVEITSDQIKSTQVYNYGCVKICPTYY